MIALATLSGGALGLGVFLLVWRALPGTPVARKALRRLYPAYPTAARSRQATLMEPLLQRWWRPPDKQLRLIGATRRQYATSLLMAGGITAAAPTVGGALFITAGVGLALVVPLAAALALGGFGAWAAHRSVIAKADKARYEFRRAVCSYLDLVSLELAAGHGPVAALERAAAGVDGWVFERVRETLLRAQLQLHQPWDELRELGDAIDVPELGDVGDIVRGAGADGAVVTETLGARADSLRDQIRTEALARAKTTTTKLDIPGAALLLVLAVFVIYPLLTRIG